MGRGTLAISILDISIKLYVLFMLQKEYISLSACPNEFMQCQNTCFFLNNNTMSWDEAQHACIQLDARSHLLLLNHKQKDQNIRRCLLHSFLGHTELWIDGIYNGRQKCWIWASNQSALQYQAFSRRTITDDAEWKCIVLNSQLNYKWSSRDCFSKKASICELDIDT